MTATFPKPRTAPHRLRCHSRHSRQPSTASPNLRYLILPAFIAVVLLIVGLGIAIATASTEMFQVYTHWLHSLSRSM
jgi:hypothetical protein